MDTDDDDSKQPSKTLGAGWEKLNGPASGQGQTEEWREREAARRAGRRRKDWWAKDQLAATMEASSIAAAGGTESEPSRVK